MKIELVPYKPVHLEALFAWRSDPACVQFNPLAPVDLKTLGERYANAGSDLARLADFREFKWMISVDGSIVGTIGLTSVFVFMGYAELGYQIAEAHYGKGIATAAIRHLAERIFAETSLRRLVALAHEENIGSCRALEKVGFRREGLLREHFVIGGKPANEVYFGLLKGELK